MKGLTIQELRWITQSLRRDITSIQEALETSKEVQQLAPIAELEIANKEALYLKVVEIIAKERQRNSKQR